MVKMIGEFFHANNIETEIGESLETSFVSPNLSSKNEIPGNDIEEALLDHTIDSELLTDE